MNLDRRGFLRGAAATGLLSTALPPIMAQTAAATVVETPITDKTIALNGDSPPTTHEAEVEKLLALMTKGPYADVYLKGGAVTEFEQHMAKLLGKEDAGFFPTGTLANNLAVRLLCGDRKNLLIQHEAHLYQDEGEGPSLLSGINMIPTGGPGKPIPPLEDWAEALDVASKTAYYPMRVGALSIESPVRRGNGTSVPYPLAKQITDLARSRGLGTHLDGSRLFLLSGTPGFEVKSYCALFDTVFVSLYKFFGAPFGAILAGKKELIAEAKELRHTFGGLTYHGWMAALPALSACDGFEARFTQAHLAAEKLLKGLQAAGGFTVQRVENGSNIAFVMVSPAREKGLADRLKAADIHVAPIVDGKMKLWWNESILRRPTEELLAVFTG